MEVLIYTGILNIERKNIKMVLINFIFILDIETSKLSVRQTFSVFHFLLGSYYVIKKADKSYLEQRSTWDNVALFIMPNSEDIIYNNGLGEIVSEKILKYLKNGGKYIGIAAGGYYASAYTEIESNNTQKKQNKLSKFVIFPGIARSIDFSKYICSNDSNKHLALIHIEDESYKYENDLYYYHSGVSFVNADQFLNTRILATYKEINPNNKTPPNAAIIHCKIGKGEAVLFGVHPEYSGFNTDLKDNTRNYLEDFDRLLLFENNRTIFLRHILQSLGLRTTSKPIISSEITNLHLFSKFSNLIKEITNILYNISEIINGERVIRCENDSFYLQKSSTYTFSQNPLNNFHDYDYEIIPKYIKIHKHLPTILEIPFFNHEIYFKNLLASRTLKKEKKYMGNIILYGETVSSSQTLLNKNLKLLRVLPTGFVFVATQQIAGKGRKNNVWISPQGVLAYSLIIRQPEYLIFSSIVFIQYLVSLAIVEAIKTYDNHYNELDIHIKWPNDICVKQSEENTIEPSFILNNIGYIKIAGILIDCKHIDNEFLMIIGCGINVSNFLPTTSLEIIIKTLNARKILEKQPLLSEITQEKLLARIMTTLESMYYEFCLNNGFKLFEHQYYKYWLHTGQIVTLEDNSNAVITGINPIHGGLNAEGIENGKKNGKIWELYPDSNSFDMIKGLIKKKV
ncbi:biotin-[acetyl-CoA-carboxylase] ligase [Pneumocystis murina B123]|uniref:Biotin-[acetyl-CoA-carboxylase] ligase n=1 Tax=Pneumocystis murina (strain B123) TaxID=1069680 RepID=M7NVK6_PNEMU|nr:biotin-[acetyl-CoA-carboxylase] ligase [Pneumocystis murina B123]EMR11322.1 biotin-[acetyl-CoA-carboxylase] ligase [Pneumocystis murina B123]